MTATQEFRLVDAEGNVIARRSTIGAVRNFARLSNAGKRGVAILSATGESFPVVKPATATAAKPLPYAAPTFKPGSWD